MEIEAKTQPEINVYAMMVTGIVYSFSGRLMIRDDMEDYARLVFGDRKIMDIIKYTGEIVLRCPPSDVIYKILSSYSMNELRNLLYLLMPLCNKRTNNLPNLKAAIEVIEKDMDEINKSRAPLLGSNTVYIV